MSGDVNNRAGGPKPGGAGNNVASSTTGTNPATGTNPTSGPSETTPKQTSGEEQPVRPITHEGLSSKTVGGAPQGPGAWLSVQQDPRTEGKKEEPPSSLKELKLTPRLDVKYMKSPEDWHDEPMYFALLDRFNRGAGAISVGDPADHDTLHGGNIKGLIDKLDYIRGMGMTSLWISPVVKNPRGTYHGYAPENFCAVDPSKGSMEDVRTLVREAHKRGIRIILDMVLNHSCDAFDYVDGDKTFNHKPMPPKEIVGFKRPIYPLELRSAENYARRGEIRDWENPEQSETGDFYKYKAFDLERRPTQDAMIKIAQWWIRETGVDGFRCDAVKHISTNFWSRFNKEVRDYAASLGMKNFMLLGEAFEYDSEKVATYMKLPPPAEQTEGPNRSPFGYMFDIPSFLKSGEALHGQGPTQKLEAAFHDAQRSLKGSQGGYTNLIDSHDVPRFLRPGDDPSIVGVGLAQTLFSVGQPCIYYGTEQGFQDRMDIDKTLGDRGRTDMFDGAFKSPGKEGDNFDTESAGYKLVQQYTALRRAFPALARGEQYARWNTPDRSGPYAFSRIYKGQEVIVILNPSDETRRVNEMWVDRDLTPPGTKLVDALSPGYSVVTSEGRPEGSQLNFEIPPKSVRVLVAAQHVKTS